MMLLILCIGFTVIYAVVIVLTILLEMPQNSALRRTMAAFHYRWLAWLVLASPALAAYLRPWRWITLPPPIAGASSYAELTLSCSVLITSSVAAVWMNLPREPNKRLRVGVPIVLASCFAIVVLGITGLTLFARR